MNKSKPKKRPVSGKTRRPKAGLVDEGKSRTQLIAELTRLRRRIARQGSERNGALPDSERLNRTDEKETRKKVADPAQRVRPDGEEKYRQFFETESDALFLVDKETGAILEANTSAVDLYGYKREELLRMRNTELSAEPDKTRHATNHGLTAIPIRWHRKKSGEVFPVEITSTYFQFQGRPVHLAAIRDVSRRIEAERTLRESEERFRVAAENASDLIWEWNIPNKTLNWFGRIDELLGYERGEFPRTIEAWEGILHPDDHNRVMDALYRHLKIQSSYSEEYRVLCKDGTMRYWIDRGTVFRDPRGNPYRMIGACTDITERKRAEEALRDSKHMLQIVLDAIPAAVFWKNRDSIYLGGNRTWLEAAGLKSSEEVVGKSDYDLPWGKKQADSFREYDRQIIESGIPEFGIVESYNRGDSTQAWVRTNKIPLKDAKGNVVGVLGTYEDITEKKQAEESLRESEAKLTEAMKIAKLGTWEYDVVRDLFTFNDQFYSLFHTTSEREGGYIMSSAHYAQKFVHPGDMGLVGAEIQKALETTDPDYYSHLDHRIIRTDGEIGYITVHIRVEKDAEGRTVKTHGVNQDITERKRVEEVLQVISSRQQTLLAAIPDIVMEVNEDKIYVWANEAGFEFFGEDVIGKEATDYFVGGQDTYDAVKSLLDGEERTIYVESWQRRRDGEKRLLAWWCRVLKDGAGKAIGALSSARDITEKKRAEEHLRQSEAALNQAQRVSHVGSWRWQIQSKRLEWSDEMYRIVGVEKEGFTGDLAEVIARVIHPDDRDAVEKSNMSVIKNKKPVPLEYRVVWPDGTVRTVWAEAGELESNDAGNPMILTGIVQDITERKRAEEALNKERSLVRALMDNVPDHIYFKDAESRFIMMNKSQAERFGLSDPGQAEGKTDFDFFTEEHARQAYEDEQRIIRTGLPVVAVEEKETWPGHRDTWVSTTKIPLSDENGNIIGTFGISRDITERRTREQEYKTIISTTIDGFWIADMQGRFLDVNEAYCRLAGYSRDEFLTMSIPDVEGMEKREETVKRIQTIKEVGHDRFETHHRCKNGEIVDVEISVNYLPIDNGRMFVFIRDITERKLMEEHIRADVREKEVLLREIHHRVKNNLQVISSLLNLQSDRMADSQILAVFRESQNRILSMSMVHEALYQSESLSEIDFSEYLQTFVRRLFSSYCIDSETVELRIDAEPITLEIEMAVPCGLIVNELVSNALKHAFPRRRKQRGFLEIAFRRAGDDAALTVRDNGVGLPESVSVVKSESLGMKLVGILTEQLGGKVSVKRKPGTEFRINFPIAETLK